MPAYTVGGYLPCTAVKEGYFNADEFITWIQDSLLPVCRPGTIIIMDNCSTHVSARVEQVITEAGFQLKYLPPYSPDYNPIELTFSVLKAWVKRWYHRLWPMFRGDFGAFLLHAIQRSKCDRFGQEHFRHSSGGYIFEGDYEAFQRELENMVLEDENEDED